MDCKPAPPFPAFRKNLPEQVGMQAHLGISVRKTGRISGRQMKLPARPAVAPYQDHRCIGGIPLCVWDDRSLFLAKKLRIYGTCPTVVTARMKELPRFPRTRRSRFLVAAALWLILISGLVLVARIARAYFLEGASWPDGSTITFQSNVGWLGALCPTVIPRGKQRLRPLIRSGTSNMERAHSPPSSTRTRR